MRGIVVGALGLAVGLGNLYYWFRLVRGEPRFREWVKRRYGVTITLTRGHWNVRGSGSRLRDLGLEFLQLAYFMAGFFVWGLGMLLAVGLMSLIED
jgi:hypothetical protein